jgi:hypothetical protein
MKFLFRVSSTARITSPTISPGQHPKFEFFALLSFGMFLKANKVTWGCCLPAADEKLGGHLPNFLLEKATFLTLVEYRRNISFVTIELVLIGCPAEVCTFADPKTCP